MDREIDKLIKGYFVLGFNNREILGILAHAHGTIISVSTLKRRLKSLGLFRRKRYSDIVEVALFIMQQQETSGVLHGYRWMHLKCIQAGFNIPRDTVSDLMQLLDPKSVKSRLRRKLKRRRYISPGPNFVWHVDSYDKLKPYGIAINGCVDGYSRYVVWLEASTTNSDPKVIAGYYMNAVQMKGGCPRRLRTDLGTENSCIRTMQMFLRREHDDVYAGEKSYIAGASTHNQRIEWFWGLLRKQMAQFYMDLFADLFHNGDDLFSGDLLDKNLMQFCFMDLIQKELNSVRNVWNTHTLQSKQELGGGKRPILLYTVPTLYAALDNLCEADETDMRVCAEQSMPKSASCSDETVYELCILLMEQNGMSEPTSASEARALYTRLRQIIRNELERQ